MLDNRSLTLVEDIDMRRVIPLFVLDQGGVRQFWPTTMPGGATASAPRESAAVAPASLGR
jgi:hypothetical protein